MRSIGYRTSWYTIFVFIFMSFYVHVLKHVVKLEVMYQCVTLNTLAPCNINSKQNAQRGSISVSCVYNDIDATC